jgi:hypothetical protein
LANMRYSVAFTKWLTYLFKPWNSNAHERSKFQLHCEYNETYIDNRNDGLTAWNTAYFATAGLYYHDPTCWSTSYVYRQ